jgi:hypothetical protein
MGYFLFEDTIDGGCFFVNAVDETEAYEIVWEEYGGEHPFLMCDDVMDYYPCLGEYSAEQAYSSVYEIL